MMILLIREVNHKDGNKDHNYPSNLEYITSSDNQKHAYKMGIRKRYIGESSCRAAHSESDVRMVCKMLANGNSVHDINILYPNFAKRWITSIRYKHCWKHISDEYFS